MSILLPQTGDIPNPRPTITSKPYWDGCARGELLFQRCTDCGAPTHTPAVICSACCSDRMVWEQSSGLGTIYSFTIVWRPQMPAFSVPYVPAIVTMDEGWTLMSSLIGCEPEDAVIGMRVAAEFHPTAAGTALPYFSPAPSA